MIKNTIIKKSLTTAGILLLSFTVESATYDLLEEQKTDQLLLPNTQLDNSFFNLDPTPQQAINDQKRDYIEALELIKNKKLKEAEKKINTLLKNNPKEPTLYSLYALLAVVNNQPELAIKSYKKAINLDKKNLKTHLALAKLLLETGDINQAKEYSNKALVINEKSTYAYFLLAEIARRQNKLQDASNLLLTAKQKNQGNATQEIAITYNIGKLYVLQGQPKKTLTLAKDIVQRYPEESSALSILANAQLANNQIEQAKITLKKIISQEKEDVQHRFILAKLLLGQPEKEKDVLKLIDEISSIAPDNSQIQIQNAAYLIKLKNYQGALEVAAKVKKLSPETGAGQLIEGEVYLAEKNLEQALLAFQKSYKIKPNGKVLFVIVDIMMTKGKQSNAIDLLNKELNKNNKNLDAHFKIATIYQQQNNLTESEKHYKTILTSNPNNIIVLNNLAWIYNQQNNPKALLLAEQAYQLAPKSASISDTYGSVLVKQGNLKQGIEVLEKASKLAPTNYNIQYHLAEAYTSSGNHKPAIKILNRILNTEQNFSEKDAAITLSKKLGSN